jgi:hypothetical protein
MPWRHVGELRYSSTFLDLGTRWGEWSASRPYRFTPGTHWIGSRAGPRTGLDAVEKGKILHCRNPNLGLPARRYTDCANPTPRCSNPVNGISDLFFWKLYYPLLFVGRIFTKKYFRPDQISDGFKCEYGIVRSYRTICHVINHCNNQCICRAIILCLEGDPHVSTQYTVSGETHWVVINENWEINSSRLKRESKLLWLSYRDMHWRIVA